MDNRKLVTIDGLEARETGCNLGHTDTPQLLWVKDGFNYLRCPACHLVWVNPQLTNEAVSSIYQKTFNEKLQAHPRPTNFLAYQARLRMLQPYNTSGRLLDVGCFSGNFLLAAQSAGWTDIAGTEISSSAIEYARATYGLTIHEGDLLEIDLPAGSYDAITLSDVIEHVRDPLKTLQRIHSLLRPGGALYMDTPHYNSVPRWIFGKEWNVFFPWHRTYFSAGNMRLALETAGFRITKIQTVGVLPFSRFSAWKAYKSASSTPTKTESVKSSPRRVKNVLRPLWLGFKKATEIPFVILSSIGIHVGAKLIVHAEKPESRPQQ